MSSDFWNRFLAHTNFALAWRRITTGQNIYYKRFYREVYLAYEVALDANLECLVRRIKGGTYNPSLPDRLYIPKTSGLQRPITLLTIEDQIVWQAIANVLEHKWAEKRKPLEGRAVFSSLPSNNAIFFCEHWKISYNRFLSKIKTIYQDNKWVARFDLAAFFDTISHDHIVRLVTKMKDSDIARLVKRILAYWSAERFSGSFSHGIPQGPAASAYLAELIFLPIDTTMSREANRFHYIRYVDDIRIFAHDEDSVRGGIVKLEELCRNRGLIPKADKTSTFLAKSLEEAIGRDFSLTPEWIIDRQGEKLLLRSLDVDSMLVTDFSKFKLFLYRCPALEQYLNILLVFFEKYPYLIDAFVVYLSKFRRHTAVISFLRRMLLHKCFAYEYVEGNVWYLLSYIDPDRTSALFTEAANRLFERQHNFLLRYGLLLYLAPFVNRQSRRLFNRYLFDKSSILQSLLLSFVEPYFSPRNYRQLLQRCLMRTNVDAGLVAAVKIAANGIDYNELTVARRPKDAVRNCLGRLGVTRSRAVAEVHHFEELLNKRYNAGITDWKPYLKKEYKHAHMILALSEKAFEINRSTWLCLIDSLNDIILRCLIRADTNIRVRLTSRQGGPEKYGLLLDRSNAVCQKYFTITDTFRIIHRRRCSVPETHPYDERTANKNKPLRLGERNNLYGKLKVAYTEVERAFNALQ